MLDVCLQLNSSAINNTQPHAKTLTVQKRFNDSTIGKNLYVTRAFDVFFFGIDFQLIGIMIIQYCVIQIRYVSYSASFIHGFQLLNKDGGSGS